MKPVLLLAAVLAIAAGLALAFGPAWCEGRADAGICAGSLP